MATQVGDLYAELRMDASQFTQSLNQGRQGLDTLDQAARRSAQVAQQSGDAQVQAYGRMRQAAIQAADSVRRSHDRAGEAAEQVRVAEERLTRARSTGDAGRIEQAERGLVSARRDSLRAAEQAGQAVDRLEAANRRAAQSARDIDFDRVEREARNAAQATNRIQVPSSIANAANNAAEAIGNIGQRAAQAGGSMGSAGGSMGGSFISGFAERLGPLSAAGGPIAMAVMGVAAIGLGAGAILANAISDGMQREADLAKVQASLGINDAAMSQIGRASSQAYMNGWGESVAENAQAAKSAIQAGMLTGEELAPDMSKTVGQLQMVSGMLESDVKITAQAAGQAMKTGLVDTAEDALDLFVKAEQKGLNMSDDILETTVEYGTQFRQVGLSGEMAFALMSQAANAGARDADTAADAIKEFAIRSIDGSESSAAAYQALGLNAEEYTQKMAKGGDSAQEAMHEIFALMNDLTDPVERNTVAVGLFGTKAEDLGQAMFAMNLDTAIKEFGEVDGAARRAGDTIQNTTAAKIEQAKRSIEESMFSVKSSLSEAFGPTLQKIADWITTHKAEIIEFFGKLADGALVCLDAIAAFTSGSLRFMADFADYMADAGGRVIEMFGNMAEKTGSVLKHIPGMGDLGEALEKVGSGMAGYRDKVHENADTMRNLADAIDNRVRPGLDSMRTSVQNSTQAAADSQRMFDALGDSVTAVPTDHGIAISDNSPEAIARLAALNLKTRTLEDGTVEVYAETAEGQRIIDNFVNANNGRKITTYTTNEITDQRVAWSGGPGKPLQQGPVLMPDGSYAAEGMVRSRANGGIDNLPDQAVIEPPRGRGLFQWAEDETEGEAFIPLAKAKRARSLRILAETARRLGMAVVDSDAVAGLDSVRNLVSTGDYDGRLSRFGVEEDNPFVDAALGTRNLIAHGDYDGSLSKYGVEEDNPAVAALLRLRQFAVRQYADGGVVGGMTSLVATKFPALTMTSGARNTNDHHGSGLAADFSNGSGNTDEQLALANYIADRYPDSLELIYSDPRFTRNIKDGKVVDPSFYGAATMAQHQNHVHWARKTAPSLDDELSSGADGSAAVDNRTSRQKNIDAVIAEGKRRNMSDKQIKTAVAAVLAESDGVMYANAADPETLNFAHEQVGSDGTSSGILQQSANGAWGTAADRMDPTKSAGMFYEELAKLDIENMTEAQAAQAVQRSAFSDGSNYAAKMDEADQLIAESNARGNGAGDTSSSTAGKNGDPVYVTNWPAGFGSGSSSSSGSKSSGTSAPAESSDPAETVQHDVSTVEGRRSLFDAVRAKYFANGGFGGVGAGEDHTAQIASAGSWRVFGEPETGGEAYIPLSPAKKNRSLAIWAQTGQRLGAFGAGAAMAASSGWDENGNFVGFSTAGTGAFPGLDKALEELSKLIQPVPAVVIEHAEITDPEGFIADAADQQGHEFPLLQNNI